MSSRATQVFKTFGRPRTLQIMRELGIFRPVDATEQGAKEFKKMLEDLGTTFIKLGQLLASRPDLVPEVYVETLKELQDSNLPFAFIEVENIFIEAFGKSPKAMFGSFQEAPLASGSIAQIHRATLDGKDVIVKVRRPGIEKEIEEDLLLLKKVAAKIEKRASTARILQLSSLVEELSINLREEIDLRIEAKNMEIMREHLEEFEDIVIPEVFEDFFDKRVIVMQEIIGEKVGIGEIEKDRAKDLAEEVFKAYIKQITVCGVYHADPHEGNVFITDDGKLALLDFGLLGHIDASTRFDMSLLLFALSEHRADEVSDLLLRMSNTQHTTDEQYFAQEIRNIISHHQQGAIGQMNIGESIIKIQRLAIRSKISLPLSFALIGKTLSQVDSLVRNLNPEADPMKILKGYSRRIILQQIGKSLEPTSLFENTGIPLLRLSQLPQRLESMIWKLDHGELKVGIKPVELDQTIQEARTITNRLSWALMVSALIISSALLMNVEGVGTILGYPALGLIGFVVAAFAILLLLWKMWHTRGGL